MGDNFHSGISSNIISAEKPSPILPKASPLLPFLQDYFIFFMYMLLSKVTNIHCRHPPLLTICFMKTDPLPSLCGISDTQNSACHMELQEIVVERMNEYDRPLAVSSLHPDQGSRRRGVCQTLPVPSGPSTGTGIEQQSQVSLKACQLIDRQTSYRRTFQDKVSQKETIFLQQVTQRLREKGFRSLMLKAKQFKAGAQELLSKLCPVLVGWTASPL